MNVANETIHVAFAVDGSFASLSCVAVESAVRHCEHDVHVHVLHDPAADKRFGPLRRVLRRLGTQHTFHPIDPSCFAGLPVTDHVSLATYYRLAIARLIDEAVPRVIYLDADLIVRDCLSLLANVPPHPSGIAAVPEPSDSSQRLGMTPETPYLNAGVLVMDLDTWRNDGVTETLFDIAEKHRDRLRFWDQDVLALYLQGQWQPLDRRWNCNHRCFFGQHRLALPDDPAIVHFSGSGLKPWSPNVVHPYAEEFWRIADRLRRDGVRIDRPGKKDWWRRRMEKLGIRRRAA
ncbi:glycosyltransferase family 8 protein [Crateriforma conspicua]|uniref:glycosyltransferase family 8 protein n=1 Tax=Crateriforma conspicua TaxID=2527996 RepID=UPI001187B6C2|nr:glycosyltransferase family 8 protein [Crateriforma conspicua]QDV61223.1 General stress protein A [Crateriforma conspicua]